jgi:hypothetical protein
MSKTPCLKKGQRRGLTNILSSDFHSGAITQTHTHTHTHTHTQRERERERERAYTYIDYKTVFVHSKV